MAKLTVKTVSPNSVTTPINPSIFNSSSLLTVLVPKRDKNQYLYNLFQRFSLSQKEVVLILLKRVSKGVIRLSQKVDFVFWYRYYFETRF